MIGIMTAVVAIFAVLIGPVTAAFIVVWKEIKATKTEVKIVHSALNSRLDEMLKLTREVSHAAGVREEKVRSELEIELEQLGKSEKPDAE